MDRCMEISESEKKALDVMENPKGVTREDVDTLQGESLQDCQLLDDISFLLEQETAVTCPDIDQELQYFHRKRQDKIWKRRVIGWSIAIGAVAALFISGIFLLDREPEALSATVVEVADSTHIVLEADPSPQEVILDVEDAAQQHETYSLKEIEKTPVAQTATVHTKEINYLDKNEEQEEVNTQIHTLSIPRGQMFKIVLSDSTEVFLNAGSRLAYPTKFVRKERIVTLEGEAYFKVARDKDHPFIVKTGTVETRVLGTEFNISSYSASDVHVTLIEGSVQVDASGSSKVIVPGQDLCIREDGSMTVEEVDLHSYMYWRDGYFYFDNLPLVDVLKSIGRWYNVGVEFRNTEAMGCKVHFLSERFQGLEHTLTLLNRMEKADIRLEGNILVVD